ncbi:MAG: putative aliphatic sulfonates transport permease protein SsuC [Fibrobacterota bacterium]|jgi:NitT/TauT family transport system permease protein
MRPRSLLPTVLPPILFLLASLAAWEAVVRLWEIPSYLLPSPWAILSEAIAERGQLVPAGLVTLAGAVGGFAASLLVGIATAMLFAQARWIRASLYPWAIFLQTVPIVAIAPLIVLWFGAGFGSIVLVSFLLSVFPILSNTVEGLTRIDPQLLELFRLHGAGRLQTLFKLRLPHSVPFVVAGAKVAAGLTVIGAIVGEFFAGYGAQHPGLGYLILQTSGQLKTELLFASVGLSTLLGLAVFLLTGFVSRLVLARLEAS